MIKKEEVENTLLDLRGRKRIQGSGAGRPESGSKPFLGLEFITSK